MKTRRVKKHPHVYICFWGLTRSLKYTLESIQHVLRKFPNRTVFLHTYRIDKPYTNVRSREINIKLDADEWKLLNPDYHIVEDQSSVPIDFKEYRTSGDPWDNEYKTLDNFLLGMYSLKRVTELLFSKVKNPSRVIFMRPDVKFLTSIPSSIIDSKTIVVPKFHSWSFDDKITRPYGGVNDRFAIASRKGAYLYGTRFDSLLDYSMHKSPHSETFLRDYLKAHEITVIKKDICFHRVRATGEELNDC